MLWKDANTLLLRLNNDKYLINTCRTILMEYDVYIHKIRALINELIHKVINPTVPDTMRLKLAKPDRDLWSLTQRLKAIELKLNEISEEYSELTTKIHGLIKHCKQLFFLLIFEL